MDVYAVALPCWALRDSVRGPEEQGGRWGQHSLPKGFLLFEGGQAVA